MNLDEIWIPDCHPTDKDKDLATKTYKDNPLGLNIICRERQLKEAHYQILRLKGEAK